jgi:glycosyltransferase involved in cell wall biosynthesis
VPTNVPTIVGVTPLAADRDSRACRIAASCARLGYRSMLVEALPSADGFSLPGVELVSLRRRRPSGGPAALRVPLRFITDSVLRPAFRLPRADLVYLHAFYQYPGVRLRTWLRKVPIVYDAHDFYSSLMSRREQPRLQRALEDRVERAVVKRAAAIVTVSSGVADLYRRDFGVEPEVLMNSHDARLDAAAPKTARTASNADASDTVVVVVGQWKREQPVTQVLEALARTQAPVRVVFLGNGYADSCAQQAQRLGLGERVVFVPAVRPTEVVPFIADADAAAVLYRPSNPSVRQCLPNGLFQPLAAGLPVVFAQDLPLVSEVAGDAGLPVDADDPGSIAQALDRLASDRSLRDRLAAAAASRGHEVAWEHEERRLAAILDRALGARSATVNVEDGDRAA